jgi:hypothetical protein
MINPKNQKENATMGQLEDALIVQLSIQKTKLRR